MKKQLLLTLLLLLIGLSVSAQKAPKQSTLEKNLRKHVSYLASDELEGRRTGEKGATFAAGYVSNMFQRYKLKAGYADADGGKAFLQPFSYVSGVTFGPATALEFQNASGDSTGNLDSKMWKPYIHSPAANIDSSGVVFAVYGISSARLGHDDYRDIDVRGKIVVVLDGVPGGDHPHSPFNAYNVEAKANIAKEKGAAALIVIAVTDELDKERLARANYNQTLGETAVPVAVITRSAGSKLLNLKDAAELNQIEKWLESKPEFAEVKFAGLKPQNASLKIDVKKTSTEAYNVIGIIEGRDQALKNEAIVIGAHYDHLGYGGQGSLAPNSKEVHNGADDNASGTSALIELARQFAKAKSNRRTMIFIAFGGEEEGLLGSKAYIENPVFPIANTIAMINMDMVGRLRDRKLTVGGIGTAARWDAVVRNNNRRVPDVYTKDKDKNKTSFASGSEEVELFKLELNQDGFGPSDHSSFYAARIPVLFFFTGTHSDYHKPSDDADKINYTGLEAITGFVGDLVNILDRNPTRPVYKVAQSSAPQGGRRGFNVSLGTIPAYGDSDNTGLKLDGVRTDSAADKAGIKGGDKITKIADKEIRNISDYMFMLGEMKAGEKYEIVVMRGEEKLTLTIVPDPRQ
ncbi:MAG: M20/M25/M40 family metallo-hydrolase [Acidobacteriota bacterium]|nr:M20/M25/M40 family metallo-hydrolase [Acidobacteriota bacterium]